ncbi:MULTISPECIES: Stp1/IreP family PP2C-type Ser/Thr phosphatase [Vagococcus]|uniref:protein-serine/threonine phosphatase n=1 Tax=Vagococcus teuberi TaxID=519472 RepID=A0A1J0A3I7_9ENTE|nr:MULTISPECIES: Stp1/IreP family PP2C-type Ser/Thr phosphatase [Vagococcus]APB30483.1 protein phosphatase [Vagococcus teuberi]RHH70236.1 Stp1/IreP family PP2C-type Ser/Thr phosphatase [Vagococcus sp. AM17-17]
MQIEFQTSVGRKRKNNQDTVGVYKNKKNITLAIVADGMGGHQAGDTASYLAVTGLGEVWEETMLTQKDDVCDWLVDHIQEENARIFDQGSINPEMFGMGTTIVSTVILEDELILAHVGDSRAYIVRDEEIKQLTDDHSLVNELIKTGEISAEMAQNHPKKNILVRSIGVPGEVEVDISLISFKPQDMILLCSDGLTNMLTDDEIKEVMLTDSLLKNRVEKLIELANIAGGTDNITVLIIDFDDDLQEDTP